MITRHMCVRPFRFFRVLECRIHKENDVITEAKFVLDLEMDMKRHEISTVRETEQAELVVREDLKLCEIEEILEAFQAYHIDQVVGALRENGITDVLSVFALDRVERLLPVLYGVQEKTRTEILERLDFYHAMKEKGVEDVMDCLRELRQRQFFYTWSKKDLFHAIKRNRLLCRGTFSKLSINTRYNARTIMGVIQSDRKDDVRASGIAALIEAKDGWHSLMKICRKNPIYQVLAFR